MTSRSLKPLNLRTLSPKTLHPDVRTIAVEILAKRYYFSPTYELDTNVEPEKGPGPGTKKVSRC
eukprot:4063585-Heterocapsa_arctica.AAC.1